MSESPISVKVPKGCTFSQQAEVPCPLYIIAGPYPAESFEIRKFLHQRIFGQWLRDPDDDMLTNSPCLVRWVQFDRMPIILRNGIDVEPTSKVLWALNIIGADESLRVGGIEKILIVLNPQFLQRSWKEVPASTDQEELETLRRDYPAVFTSEDGDNLWLSRVSTKEHGIHPYEKQCGFWISGSPWEALRSIYVVGPSHDILADRVQSTIAEISNPKWR